jgi:hypothetical protein
MTRFKRRRAGLGVLLAAALGAMALLALPGMAAAKAKDRNHDHIPDRWEKRHKLSLKVNQARRDQDHDGLNNLGEYKAGDNPRNPDTNHNGIEDGEEHAGTIASFDPETGKLTISLYGGETVTGLVTEETEIECGCSHHGGEGEEGATSLRSGDFNPGEEGTGPPGQGEDESDDPPGHDGTPPGASEGPGRGFEHQEHSGNCSAEDLVVGAVVKEAELQLDNGVATFSKIELEQVEESSQGSS